MSRVPLKNRVVKAMVRIRTSFGYVYALIAVVTVWIVGHRMGWLHIDNPELTYLNLMLSVEASLASVVLLIYTSRIAERQEHAAAQRARASKKLGEVQHHVHELEEDIQELREDLS